MEVEIKEEIISLIISFTEGIKKTVIFTNKLSAFKEAFQQILVLINDSNNDNNGNNINNNLAITLKESVLKLLNYITPFYNEDESIALLKENSILHLLTQIDKKILIFYNKIDKIYHACFNLPSFYQSENDYQQIYVNLMAF